MTDKERVVARLEGKNVADLIIEHAKLENLIVDIIADKKNWNIPCDCIEDLTPFYYVDDDTSTVIKVCMRCGGDLE